MRAHFYIYHLADIADEIDVKKFKRRLKKLKSRPLRLRHFTPAYLNFPNPPVEMSNSTWILTDNGKNARSKNSIPLKHGIEISTQLKFYSLGSVTIRYDVPLEGASYEEIFAQAQEISNNVQFLKKTESVVKKARNLVENELGIKTYRGFFEDYHILWIQDKFKTEDMERHKISVAQFLRNEIMLLSESEQNEAYRYRFSYTPNDLTVIDWDRAVTINVEAEDDVWDVLEYANLQLLELRYYDSELDKRLEEIYRFAKSRRLFWLDFYRTPQLLRKTLQLFIDFSDVEERINAFLKLTGDEYLSRVYQAAAVRLNIHHTQEEMKQRLIDTRELYETLAHDASAIRAEVLEAIIIMLIMFEIIFALFR